MKPQTTVLFFLTALLLYLPSAGYGQIDLYSKMNDPYALFTFDNIDSGIMRYVNHHGLPEERDPTDNYFLLASDSGAGVITHFWMTCPDDFAHSLLKIYIDDSLILFGRYDSVIGQNHGFLRAPFDSTYPTFAVESDVQIPFHRSFKITYMGPLWNIYYAVSWRPFSDISLLPKFDLSKISADQRKAEQRFYSRASLWSDSSKKTEASDQIQAHTTSLLFDAKGPSIIRDISLQLDRYDSLLLDSLWLSIYWDNCPKAAVCAPLSNFFCAPAPSIAVRSLYIQWDSLAGFCCLFPMPFAGHARIVLENRSASTIGLRSTIAYHDEPVDRNRMGYFYATFNEINPTHFGVHHHVLHTFGRGRFVGMNLRIPATKSIFALEGDPIVLVDSDLTRSFRYTGTEDYFDGAWYFTGKLFSAPFCGHIHQYSAFYRLHILDAVDFRSSFDFDFQHGYNDDVKERYQTVAYYYKPTPRYWALRDTITAAEEWSIAGNGYQPNERIELTLSGAGQAGIATADSTGAFATTVIVPSQWPSGRYWLQAGGDKFPTPITVLSHPVCSIVHDTLPVVLRYLDTISIQGAACIAGEHIAVYVDDIFLPTTTTAIVDSAYRFTASAVMPYLNDSVIHRISVKGSKGSVAFADEPLIATHTLRYEFEDLPVKLSRAEDSCSWHSYGGEYWSKWSMQAAALFRPKSPDSEVRFTFRVPLSDTFSVRLFMTKGSACGDYAYRIDDGPEHRYFGYIPEEPYNDPLSSGEIALGTILLEKGEHTVSFRGIGKDPRSKGYDLAPDVLLCTPASTQPFSEQWWKDSARQVLSGMHILIMPNPVSNGLCAFQCNFNAITSFWYGASITLIDGAGRVVLKKPFDLSREFVPQQLDLSAIAAGRYVLVVTAATNTGEQVFTEPLIVIGNHN